MEIGNLLTGTKWEILSLLSYEDLSPLELSTRLNTTMANISQQLRILEAMGLVTKRRVPNRDKGKPRMVFSITEDFGYITSCMKGYSGRRLVKLDSHHKFIMRAWCTFDQKYHYHLEKIYWRIEPHMPNITAIYAKCEAEAITLEIISDDHPQKKKLEDFVSTKDQEKISVKIKSVQKKSAEEGYHTLFISQPKGGGVAAK